MAEERKREGTNQDAVLNVLQNTAYDRTVSDTGFRQFFYEKNPAALAIP